MLNPTTQERIDLLSAYGSMLTDACRNHRLNPDLPFFGTLAFLAERIESEVAEMTKSIDDARFQAIWGKNPVSDAWAKICNHSFDEGFDDLNPAEDAAFDAIEAAHPTTFNPKGL